MGLEPTVLKRTDFKSAVSTIPPNAHEYYSMEIEKKLK